ncbi:beta-ketoacyl synthase [Pseudorhodoferax sp. Leaf274]|uniref:beta-ketoacyl-[acyl-carrier-protein] synthase family protein n=1 Tax=Pseudorhodoferax sp. Leaf274 TaxID=1736318 RepID=UPI00070268C6|nr:beta-ketoacyl-[acyl-carrier-protein] synthase family protein [Pseudorhodoferax sp. Leaf274]KQP41137.1 beta-ACP synthase [Pseudorhodoferax sp. Leaf274]
MRRVAITGRGVVAPNGADVPSFQRALLQGQGAIAPLEGLVPGAGAAVGAAVRGFDPAHHFAASDLPFLDRCTQFALVAAQEAITESGLVFGEQLAPRCTVILGTGAGAIGTMEDGYRAYFSEKRRRPHPLTVPRMMLNAPASHLSMRYGITGPAFVLASACASSAFAIAMGFHMVRSGAADVAVVGGSEACLTEGGVRIWEAMRVLAPDTCRPFCRDRLGLVLGEGAAILVLEALDHARQRGAVVHGEVLGCSMNSDAHHIVNPCVPSQTAAILASLQESQLTPGDICYVNAHGTGTAVNDIAETKALRGAFGSSADSLKVSSSKSMHGHTLGAAGAIEALATLVALNEKTAPPTINFTSPDPQCDLNYVPNDAQELSGSIGMSTSFAFGGHNAVLTLKAAHAV